MLACNHEEPELGHFCTQPPCRSGVLRSLSHLGLERGDLLVALGGLLLVVGSRATYLRLALLRFLLLPALPLRRGLHIPRGFLAAVGLTVHVLSCLSSRKAGIVSWCHNLS